jgi:hypothetical protein
LRDELLPNVDPDWVARRLGQVLPEDVAALYVSWDWSKEGEDEQEAKVLSGAPRGLVGVELFVKRVGRNAFQYGVGVQTVGWHSVRGVSFAQALFTEGDTEHIRSQKAVVQLDRAFDTWGPEIELPMAEYDYRQQKATLYKAVSSFWHSVRAAGSFP